MLYLISGTSADRKRYINNLVDEYKVTSQHIYEDDLVDRSLNEIVVTQTGLFGDREIYVIHDVARDIDMKSLLSGYAESDNIIVFSEATVTKKITEAFAKVSATVQDFGKEIEKKDEKMNIFSLADAFGKRDKKNLWLLFRQALDQATPEEIHGILFWQIKNMMLVIDSKENPGLNPFVYKKNQGFVRTWNRNELAQYASAMLRMFHERDMYRTLEIDLEKMILSL